MEMQNPLAQDSPARLYAVQLRLRPLQKGTLMAFSGELVHGAWLNWVRHYAPDVATWLHDGNRRRPFTCSSLQFPFSPSRMREAERNNVHLPLDPAQTYPIRLTFLQGELFPLFYDLIMRFHEGGVSGQHEPFIQLGKQTFLLEQVIANGEDSEGWTGFTSLTDLIASVQQEKLAVFKSFTLQFSALTTFNRSTLSNGKRTNYYARLPLPQFVFSNLAGRWQEIAPPELLNLIQREQIERYIQEDGITIEDYDLKAHQVHFVTHVQKGFVGTCTYQMRAESAAVPTEEGSPLSVQQQILLLARLAFYTGIGYKPAMGMGQSRYV